MSEQESYFDPYYFGSDSFWRHPYGLVYTDSVKDFCEINQAYWTLDVIGSYIAVLRSYDFVIIYFDVSDSKCSFYVKEDTGLPDVIHQEIEYTDMPVSVKLYLCDGILMFPSDY
jgi:hypothetical protein